MVLIEGMTPEALLALPKEEFDALVLSGEVVTFRIGTAEIVGNFRRDDSCLSVELGHIDGGGEGVLPTIASIADKIAARDQLAETEWIVHAVNCAKPNLKLRGVLERRGFVVRTLPDVGDVYHHLIRHTDEGGPSAIRGSERGEADR